MNDWLDYLLGMPVKVAVSIFLIVLFLVIAAGFTVLWPVFHFVFPSVAVSISIFQAICLMLFASMFLVGVSLPIMFIWGIITDDK